MVNGASGWMQALGIDAQNGLISGTVAVGAAGSGPYAVTVTATEGPYSASQGFTYVVPLPPTLTSPGNQQSREGDTISLPLSVTTADPADPLLIDATGLPPGLVLDPTSGTIGGTITPGAAIPGTYRSTVSVFDGVSVVSQSFTWTVRPYVTFTAPALLPDAQGQPPPLTNNEGDQVSLQVSAFDAGNLPLTYSATNLPDGLNIDATSGLISGQISVGAAYDLPYQSTVTAGDGTYAASLNIPWRITDPNITPAVLPDQHGTVGDTVSLQVPVQSTSPGVVYTASGLPDGLSINARTGLIAGTLASSAASAVAAVVTVTVTDGTSSTHIAFNWTVDPAPAGSPTVYPRTLTLAAPSTNGSDLTAYVQSYGSDSSPESDPSAYQVWANWGDGSAWEQLPRSTLASVWGYHSYADTGTYTFLLSVTAPDGTSATASGTRYVQRPPARPPSGGNPWPSFGGLLQAVNGAEFTIGGQTYVWPSNPNANLSPIATAQSYAASTETVAKSLYRDVLVPGWGKLQASYVQTLQAGANAVLYVVDKSLGPVLVLADQVVKATLDKAQAFVDQVKQWGGSVVQLWNSVQKLCGTLGGIDPRTLLEQIIADPGAFASTFLGGTNQALRQFFDPKSLVANIQTTVFDWLLGNEDVKQKVQGLQNLLAKGIPQDAAGLGQLFFNAALQLSNAQDINPAFIKQTIGQVAHLNPDEVLQAVPQLQALVDGGPDQLLANLQDQLPNLFTDLLGTVRSKVQDYVAGTVVPALLAKAAALVPGAGTAVVAVQTAYSGITWLNANVDKLQKVIQGAWAIVQQAATSTAQQVADQWQAVLAAPCRRCSTWGRGSWGPAACPPGWPTPCAASTSSSSSATPSRPCGTPPRPPCPPPSWPGCGPAAAAAEGSTGSSRRPTRAGRCDMYSSTAATRRFSTRKPNR